MHIRATSKIWGQDVANRALPSRSVYLWRNSRFLTCTLKGLGFLLPLLLQQNTYSLAIDSYPHSFHDMPDPEATYRIVHNQYSVVFLIQSLSPTFSKLQCSSFFLNNSVICFVGRFGLHCHVVCSLRWDAGGWSSLGFKPQQIWTQAVHIQYILSLYFRKTPGRIWVTLYFYIGNHKSFETQLTCFARANNAWLKLHFSSECQLVWNRAAGIIERKYIRKLLFNIKSPSIITWKW